MGFYPMTAVVPKQLFACPLIITTQQDSCYFSDGSEIGLCFSYPHQDSPRGLADAFIVDRASSARTPSP